MDRGGVVFRVDGSRELGLGHIVRCLSVASALIIEPERYIKKTSIHFVIRDDDGARNVIGESEFKNNVSWIPCDEDEFDSFNSILDDLQPRVVVTDIDLRGRVDEYQKVIYPRSMHISLHEHNYPILKGDRIIAPTIHPLEMAPGGTPGVTHFTGSEYLLLSPDIPVLREKSKSPCDPPRGILVTMGGGDPSGLTPVVLGAIRAYNDPSIDWKVVLGPASNYDKWDLQREFPARVEYIEGSTISQSGFLELLSNADVVITNGGTTLYEALALGRPTIAIPQNDFESVVIDLLVNEGACVTPNETTPLCILETLADFIELVTLRVEVSDKGMKMIDGSGASRIARMIAEFPI